MIIKQYRIALPADYDMQIIRTRVASRGASFDTFPGLGLKCFLISEKGKHGASGNQYAPVYLWPTVEAMWGFLAGPAFSAVKASFGVPPVETWAKLAYATASRLDDPTVIVSVTREDEVVSNSKNLMHLRQEEMERCYSAVGESGGPLAEAVGLDPLTWRLVRFKYWDVAQADLPAGLESYQVLHVSAPNIADLK